MPSKLKRLLIFVFIFGAIFLTVPHYFAATVDVGTSTVDSSINLGNTSPLKTVTSIINLLLGFLSLIAVSLILYGGFIWMTSGGSEEKIATATKILRNAVIGLVIILSAWGIAAYVLNKLVDVSSGGAPGLDGCTNGAMTSCGCGGAQTCNSGTWGPCLNGVCDPTGDPKVSCDGKPEVAECQADNSLCGPDYLCDNTDCTCKPKAAMGASCNSTPSGNKCTADNNLCGPYLKCDPNDCVCVGPPVITGVSPSGGFCVNDSNRGCAQDSDCQGGAKCDTTTPNGAANNFVTIYGYNFGTTTNLFENILTNIDFEQGAVGSVPTDWTPATQKHSSVGIVNDVFKSGKQSVRLHQDANLPFPGTCIKAVCQDMDNCTWNSSDKTCHFSGTDQSHPNGPAVYSEGEPLVWGNSYNVMWGKLTYNLAPLQFKPGETYSIQFYYKGKTASDVSVATSANLGWSSMCVGYDYYAALKPGYTWDGSKVTPTPPAGDDPCAPGFGKTCADQANTCCVNAPYQKKCYNSLNLTSIPAGTTDDWTLYSYTFQYTPEMDSWFDTTGHKEIEIGLSIGYNPTGTGTDFYVDDFTVSKVLATGQVTFLGANAGQSQLANFPRLLNPNCISSWTDREITIAVPSGAANGPIQVRREGNSSDNVDVTNNEVGPQIPDFVKNNIYRPGLCMVSPTQGPLGSKVAYQGMNLKNGTAYFGAYTSAFKGINSNFLTDNLSGQTLAPSIMPGQTTTFVERSLNGINQQSNALTFIKEQDPEAGPYISSFFPVTGASGQYVTIRGGGFGNMRGSRKVLFGTKEASYVFPEVCTNSVWSDNQIVVKVPEGLSAGNYGINVDLGNNEIINTDLLSPNNTFKFDPSQTLKTSICKIDPIRGQIGEKVNLWGEYFGNEDTDASVVFSRDISTSSKIIKDGAADKIATVVPIDTVQNMPAVTGPVHVLKNGTFGNELNFTVGKCASNSECGSAGQVCCPANTFKTGSCASDLLSCYFTVPTSVYETKFDTSLSSSSTPPFDSCNGMATFFGTCQTGQFCPNSPGKCSPFSPSAPVAAGDCGSATSKCGNIAYCVANPASCIYNDAKDACQTKTCQLENDLVYVLSGSSTTYKGSLSCREYNDKVSGTKTFVKELKVSTSCPLGWVSVGDGYCVGLPPVPCDPCPSGFTCADNGQGNNLGICQSSKICGAGASCGTNPTDPTKFSCLVAGQAKCDCCCEKGYDTRDCCAGLTCAGTCGSGAPELGSCSGCDKPGATTAEKDAACNCTMTSGKYCDISKPGGACVDCAALDANGCSAHSQQCCFDSVNNTCRGGDGTLLPGGKCAYYDCDSSNKTQCNTNATTTGQFLATSTCAASCAANPQSACDKAGNDSIKCSALGGCCFDSKNNKCTDGSEKIKIGGINFCSYYNCTSDNSACNLLTASTTGQYLGSLTCQQQCSTRIVDPGASCASDVAGACNTSICGNPYACLSSKGEAPSTSECGFCCCTPGTKNGDLTCVANSGDCSGGSRGLFCGCKSDSQCDNAASEGCGSDTCCQARPSITSTVPKNEQDKVCRNSQLVVNFDKEMNTETLGANVLLVEEKVYGNGTCPDGSTLSFNSLPPKHINIFARLFEKITGSIKSILGHNDYRAIAAGPLPDRLYCASPAVVDAETVHNLNSTSTTIYIQPLKLMTPNTKYFVVIKGDENLDSNSGVVSAEKVGLNGGLISPIPNASFNGVTFKNSYTFGFTTMDDKSGKNGLCTISSVVTSPSSFLIKNSDNDINDDDPAKASFDTADDNDRAVKAYAYSSDKQLLQPMTGYFWNWNFAIEDASVAKKLDVAGLKSNMIVVASQPGVTDKSTKVTANVNMSNFSAANNCTSGSSCLCSGENCSNKCCNASFDGDGIGGLSNLYVFLCANPWPTEKNGVWQPWEDVNQCLVTDPSDSSKKVSANCTNYNYKFYYCRDSGVAGVPDLPAVMDPALILGSSDLICSVGGAPCATQNSACGNGGTCIWNVLKESYFFRESIPVSGEITEVKSSGAGGKIDLSWYAPTSSTTPVTSFKIYYGLSTGGGSSIVKPINLTEANCNEASPKNGKIYCWYEINNLTNGKEYYFKVSSVSDKKTESPLSGSKNATPTDVTAPAKPLGVTVKQVSGHLRVSWDANTDDTLFYQISHGLFTGKTAEKTSTPNYATSSDFSLNNYRAGDHFFSVSAVDQSGNVSLPSDEIKITIPVAPKNLRVATSTSAINVSWDATTEAVTYKIYADPQSDVFTSVFQTPSTSHIFDPLDYKNNDWFFAVSAVSKNGFESAKSPVVELDTRQK